MIETVTSPVSALREELESDWRLWLTHFFAAYLENANGDLVPMASYHEEFWESIWEIRSGGLPKIRGAQRDAIFAIWSRGVGKALALDTPLPTPTGWTTMGAVSPGGLVLDHHGQPTRILGVSPVEERESARVRFSDGTSVVASMDHLWSVLGRTARREIPSDADWAVDSWGAREHRLCVLCGYPTRKGQLCSAHVERKRTGKPMDAPIHHRWGTGHAKTSDFSAEVLTTQQIADRGLRYGNERNWAIPVAEAGDFPAIESDIDPYVLGVWLGDGSASDGRISSGEADVPAMVGALEASGVTVSVQPYSTAVNLRVHGLNHALREAELLGNKHIPPKWLRASRWQRLALLQGLLDTDGYATGRARSAEFTNTNQRLSMEAAELARTLGYHVTVSEGRATLRGRDCGPKWRIRISGAGEEVFRLPRKQAAMRAGDARAHINTGRLIYIESIEPIGTVPVRCIMVESAGSLFLAGEGFTPTHNSTSTEMAAAAVAARKARTYALYVSDSQDQADQHVANVSAMLTSPTLAAFYPETAKRKFGKFGPASWRRNRLQTASGFTLDAIGLEKSVRGLKVDDQRPDLIILDDIDDINDSGVMTDRKMRTISRSILPAASPDAVVVMVQNLILQDGIMDRLVSGRADFLRTAWVSGPHPAIVGLQYEGRHDGSWEITAGKSTWPGKTMAEWATELNRMGPEAFLAECQHQLQGISDRVYPNFDPAIHQYLSKDLPKFVMLVGGLDFGGEGRTANETAGLVGGVDENGRILLLAEFKDNGANVDQRLMDWMQAMEHRWKGPGSIMWAADGTEDMGIRLMKQRGFRMQASRRGGKVPLREARVRMVATRLNVDGAKLPGLRYIPALRKWEAEVLRYRRQKPSFEGDARKRDIVQRDDHLMSCSEYLMELLDGPQAATPDTRARGVTVVV